MLLCIYEFGVCVGSIYTRATEKNRINAEYISV